MSSGTSNAPYFQPSASRVRTISSSPSGAPCDDSLPCLLGEPKPITVLQQIRVGCSVLARATSMAALRASALWPSTSAITCQPVSYTHLRAHETDSYLVCRLLLENKK